MIQPDESATLRQKLKTVDSKLAKLTEAIEVVGVSPTLASRLTMLEQEKTDLQEALREAQESAMFSPDDLSALVERARELLSEIESVARNRECTQSDINDAREHLRALLGTITLEPRENVLWANPASPNAKSLVETRPLDGLSINSPEMVAGVRSQRYQALVTALDILSTGPRAKTVKAWPSAP